MKNKKIDRNQVIEKTNKKISKNQKIFAILGVIFVLAICIIIFLLVSCNKKYQVEFNVDSDVFFTANIHKGDTLQGVKTPTKEGYTFDGWYVDGEKFDITTPIEENMTLEARFTKNKYKVTFENGNENTEVEVEFLDKVKEPKIDSSEDYEFLGWYLDDELYNFQDEVKQDLTLVAKYKQLKSDYVVKHYLMNLDGETYTLEETETFKGTIGKKVTPKVKSYKGFTSPKEQSIEIDETDQEINYYYQRNQYTLTIQSDEGIEFVLGAGKYYYGSEVKLSAKVKDGYAFQGWSNHQKQTEWTYKVKNQSETLKATSTLNHYTIHYDLNGGELKDKKESYTILDDDYTLPKPTKVGYTFVGWKVNGKDSDGVIPKGTFGDLDVTAIFKANENTPYIVQHYLMDLDGVNYTLKETEKLTGTTDNVITPETKQYDGFQSPNQITTSIQGDGTTVVEYRYERKKYDLSITYVNIIDKDDFNGVKHISETARYYYGETVDISIELEKGFHLEEWSNGTKDSSFTYTMTSSDHQSLEAKISRNEHQVTFDSQSDSVIENQKEYYGKTISKPEDPVKDGYDFLGWYRKDTEEKWNFEKDVMPDEDVSLSAKWEIHKDTVIFDANGGKFNDGKAEKVILNQELGSHIEELEEEPTREGYKFAGWYKEDTDEEWDFESDTMPGETLTIKAHWTPITYKIHFDGNTNTAGSMDEITCTYDQDCSLTTNGYTKEYQVTYDENKDLEPKTLETQTVKYNFKNWKYNDKTFTNEEKVQNLTSKENETVTLTAEWIIDENTSSLKTVSRTGYDFDGWYKDEIVKIDDLTNIESKLDLKAHWTPITYTIIFDGNGGNKNGESQVSVTATYDEETKALEAFTKSYQLIYNYDNGSHKTDTAYATFVNWILDGKTYNAGDNLGNLTSEKGKEVTLTAQWTDPTVTINEQKPTKKSAESYYTYEFKDFTDGDNNYSLSGSITLTKDTTLTAEYLKIIDSNKYIKEKLITADREDLKVAEDKDNSYNIDILDVTNSLVNENDVKRLNTILQSNDVKNIEISLEDNPSSLVRTIASNSITLSKEDDIKEKIKTFLNSITSKNTVEEKHLGSLWKKKLAITVNFDEEYAKEKNGSTFATYYIEYTHTTNPEKIVTQNKLDEIADSGIQRINESRNKPYKAKRIGNTVYATYKKEIEKEPVGNTILTGGTGLNDCMNAFFSHPEVLEAMISVYSEEEKAKDYLIDPLGSVDKAMIDGGLGTMLDFALSMLDALGLGDIGLFNVLNETTIDRPMYMRIDLGDGYVYEDGVNNIYHVEVVRPEEFDNKK